MLAISDEIKARLTRRQRATLWGQKYMIEPVFIEQALGDGNKLVAITPLNTRPNYYLIRVDSKWWMDSEYQPWDSPDRGTVHETWDRPLSRRYQLPMDSGGVVTPSEKDFTAVAIAAVRAQQDGYTDDAVTLDIIARKFNAELSHRKQLRDFPNIPRQGPLGLSWRDVPSVLDSLEKR